MTEHAKALTRNNFKSRLVEISKHKIITKECKRTKKSKYNFNTQQGATKVDGNQVVNESLEAIYAVNEHRFRVGQA